MRANKSVVLMHMDLGRHLDKFFQFQQKEEWNPEDCSWVGFTGKSTKLI